MKQFEVRDEVLARPEGVMRRLGRRFVRDRRGATAIEFGFVMVPFFALLFSIFENSFLLMVDNGVEQALNTAARQVMLGAVQKNTSINTASEFRDKMICTPTSYTRVLPTYVDCTQIVVDMRVSSSFSTTDRKSVV